MNAQHAKLGTVVGLAALIATTAVATAFPGDKLTPQASVTAVRARAMAKRLVPGAIVSEELEREAGGSGLRYTFDIKGAHGVREVGIDAKTGGVLENSAENAAIAPERGEGPEGSGD